MDDGSWFTGSEIYEALRECGEKFGDDLPLLAKRILGDDLKSKEEGYNGKGPTHF